MKFCNTSVCHFFWLQETDAANFGDDFIGEVDSILNGKIKIISPKDKFTNDRKSYMNILNSSLSKTIDMFQAKVGVSGTLLIYCIFFANRLDKKTHLKSHSFSELLRYDKIIPFIDDVKAVDILIEFLPSELPQSKSELISTMESSIFRQTVSFLDEAFENGDFILVIRELGLDPDCITSIDQFLSELEKSNL